MTISDIDVYTLNEVAIDGKKRNVPNVEGIDFYFQSFSCCNVYVTSSQCKKPLLPKLKLFSVRMPLHFFSYL